MSLDKLPMTIDGSAVRGPAEFPVEDPATGQVLALAPDATAGDLDAAFAAAARALPAWAADAGRREMSLRAAADAVAGAAGELAELITCEQGKPLAEAQAEVGAVTAAMRHFAGVRLEPAVLQDRPGPRVVVRRRPVGVVAAITPWNSPIMVAGGMKIAPALAAGNTMVVKPSPLTPLATLRLGEILAPVLPPGVVNVVSGGNDLGSWMTEHPVPRLITFTGSPRTGRLVAAAAARDLKRVVLELGGNDPAVVLDDADVADIAEALFWGAFGNAGQTCVAIKRVYVPERMHDELVAALATLADAVAVGDGRAPDTQMGPLTADSQRAIVAALVGDAVRHGGRVAAGGGPVDRPGYFYRPTILDSVTDGFPIVDEEQFGPALPVISYRDIDEVLTRVNASDYGLGGSVWTADPERGRRVADRIEAGTTWVNTHRGALWPVQPTAGLKHSGVGAELGTWGLELFTDLSVRHDAPAISARPVGVITHEE
jgi:acyl-CoA reductase-like NAD-dependent aldehyde dehydrogenase